MGSSGSSVVDLLNSGVAHHRDGDLAAAERCYRQAVLADSSHPDALHLLGMVLLMTGRPAEAIAYCRSAVAASPASAEFYVTLGSAQHATGDGEGAVTSYRRAIALDPTVEAAHGNLGVALRDMGRIDEAIAAFRAAVDAAPGNGEAHADLGATLLRKVADEPLAKAHPDAVAALERAIALGIDEWPTWEALGDALLREERMVEALAAFNRATALLRRPGGGNDRHLTFRLASRAKLVHDREQIAYLMERGSLGSEGSQMLAAYDRAIATLPAPSPGAHIIELGDSARAAIGGTYNRMWNVASAPEIPGGAVANLDRIAIENDYAAREPGITWLDGLLTPDALASLRRFCLESTIWFDCRYRNDYLGAYVEDGFYCPLLLQIGRELPRRLPGIFKNHALRKIWAYKYGENVTGIESHGDFAAVNVNFWITPDEANLDPDSGGLVLWDKKTPPEWDFKVFNTNQRAMDDFIARSGARPIRVPHRCNRAVIFNSDLIHRTDDIRFRPGYANRRINITYLYGIREGRM